ncbi:hypothetical protein SLEP1_g59855 [Rubroshorea leprosula]|uniref:B-like cyclin n=1 Tax=Rubroshorea leprosula TaxID=152421 RepID=A0AAV5MXN9_9ROSI|nr:hypothetical protein SLEP1_g59855 [Rubroshorea leprosula]
MAPSFDYAVTSLLCAEDNNSIFDDNECFGGLGDEFECTWNRRYRRNLNQNRGFHDGNALPLQSEECLSLMVVKEHQHMPNADYLNRLQSRDLEVGARTEALDWIEKVHAHFGFGPLSAYLSVNYLDRFLSSYELPKGKAWTMQLLAVACLSLAAKMEETEVPLSLDLQVGESKFVFEARTIQRMELLVLSTLKWRMQAVTPFSFIDYFLYKLNDDQFPHRTSILRSIELILSTMRGIDFLEFKPSEIAAAVAISVAKETKTVGTEKAISALAQHVQKERVLKCTELVDELSLVGGSLEGVASGAVQLVPQSPIGVLDAACLSYKSDDITVGSCTNSSHNTPETKRRRLNTPFEVEL